MLLRISGGAVLLCIGKPSQAGDQHQYSQGRRADVVEGGEAAVGVFAQGHAGQGG